MPSERAFIDYFANHPSTEAEFPATKPDDAGREKTMYIVLEKVDTNLDHFLRTEEAANLRNIFTMVHGTLELFRKAPPRSPGWNRKSRKSIEAITLDCIIFFIG